MSVVALDVARMNANIEGFQRLVFAAGVGLRAHVKAHRSPLIARRQVEAGAVGVAAQSAREAERYVAQGIDDVVIAWPWRDLWRADRFVALGQRCTAVVHVDRADMVKALARSGGGLGVRIEVDTGLHRVGVPPEEVLDLARLVETTEGVWLDGLTGYRGVESESEVAERQSLGRAQAELLVQVAGAVRSVGIECPRVCAGGTATAIGSLQVKGITEICSGSYATYDAGSAAIGLCDVDSVAVSVPAHVSLAGCEQPWAPGVISEVASGRVLPAHVCPLASRVSAYDIGHETWAAYVLPDRK